MVVFRGAVFIVTLFLCGISAFTDDELVTSLAEHLKNAAAGSRTYFEPQLIAKNQNEPNLYLIEVDFKVKCNNEQCTSDTVKCNSKIKDVGDSLKVSNEETQCTDVVQEAVSENSSEIITEPIELVYEVLLNDQYAGSGEQFIAIRKDSVPGGNWCADCPTDINVDAEGVQELADSAITHINRHKPNSKHSLRRIVRVQRQAQIVNGVRYTLLLEVDTPVCENKERTSDTEPENEVVQTCLCQVVFLEKPWLKLANGNKFRAVLSNNCTDEYIFGDEGEIVTPNKKDPIDGDFNDVYKVAHRNELNAANQENKQNRELSNDQVKDIESQIVTDVKQIEETENSNTNQESAIPEIVIRKQTGEQAAVRDVYQVTVEPVNQENVEAVHGSDSSGTTQEINISEDKRHALDGFLDFFGFEQQPLPFKDQRIFPERSESVQQSWDTSENNDFSEKIDLSLIRSKRSVNENSAEKRNVYRLAKMALETLDEFDSDDLKRVLLEILGSKSIKEGSSTIYFIKMKVASSKCAEDSNENDDLCISTLDDNNKKICHVQIEVKLDGESKVLESNCVKEEQSIKIKRSAFGASKQIDVKDMAIVKLAHESLSHYDLHSSHDNKHRVVNILSATRQVVSGTLTKIKFEIKETTCSKNEIKNNDQCDFKEDVDSKICTTSIWDKPWLPDGKQITVNCEESGASLRPKREVEAEPIKRSKRGRDTLVGGPQQINVKDTAIVKLVHESLSHYNLHSSHDNAHKIVNVLSATRQVVAGTLTKIKFEIKETTCSKNDANNLDKCLFKENVDSKICTASIWDRPWLPDGKQITVNCEELSSSPRSKRDRTPAGAPITVSVEDEDIISLAHESLNHFNLHSTHDNKHKLVSIVSATRQVVAGSLTKIKLELKETTCSKNEFKNLDKCLFKENVDSKICTASIWDRPWLPDGKQITVSCDEVSSSSRSKRQAESGLDGITLKPRGAPKTVSVDDEEIVSLADESLNHYNLHSTHDNKHKLVSILSATRQVVAGTLTKIKLEVKETTCLKTEDTNLDKCLFKENIDTEICTASIWDRPWLPDGKQITVNCEESTGALRSKREVNSDSEEDSKESLTGAPWNVKVEDIDIVNLAHESLSHYDLHSTHDNKHKVVTILSATKQVVAGTLTKIKFEVKETTCSKNEVNDVHKCVFKEGANSKICTSSIWDRPWLPNGKQITINCEELPASSRSKRQTEAELIESVRQVFQDQKLFDKFIKKYSKTYGNDPVEYERRFIIFRENLRKIDELNDNELGTAKYGPNIFADISAVEFRKNYLGLRTDLRLHNAVPMMKAVTPNIKDLPDSFDWRDKGAVTPVKNQGSCGSCWAFSVTGNIEGQYEIKYGKLLSLSEQELVDCDKLDEGCNGGLPDNAYRAIEQMGGLELENDYPYEAEDEKCHFNKTLAKVQISGAVNISSNEIEMQKWLVQNGPISIGINANAMQFYMGGVSHPWKFLCSPDNLDHGVLIVGYGISNYPLFNKTMPYWIVKNSWGESWGERGYYRVYRGDGTCGVNQMASSAII